MKITTKERNNISEKCKKLEEVKAALKIEFIGIDDVIDRVIESIKPFYIFPKSLKRPLVVNLFGMTGTGKSQLIESIVDLLELRNSYCKFDVGDYSGKTNDWELKNELSDSVKVIKDSNLIIVFDEFQHGRTIDEKGNEINRSALRPMWELIDSGIISVNKSSHSLSSVRDLYQYYELLQKAISLGVRIKNGIVTENEHVFESIMGQADHKYYQDSINYVPAEYSEIIFTTTKDEKFDPLSLVYQRKQENVSLKKPYFLKHAFFTKLFNANPAFFNYENNYLSFRETLFAEENNLLQVLENLKDNVISGKSLMKKEDYSQSLIFVVGNIDEAYAMSHSSDPDADADIFYENSLKITLPKMKASLATRFRMEQIGRLGNNMIIYPAINSNSYKLIIEKYLNQRKKYMLEKFGLDVNFMPNLNEIIYKESVFPTQGVRPVLSSFNTLIDSFITKIVADLLLTNPDAKKVKWDFDLENPQHIFTINSTKNQIKYPVKLQVENLRKSDNSDKQLYTAVHEAGHTLLAILAMKLIPKSVVSMTASSTAGGFTKLDVPSNTYITRSDYFNEIIMLLGGREAELAVFGEDNLSLGSYSDLTNATAKAVAMIKVYGLGKNTYQLESGVYKCSGIFSDEIVLSGEKEIVDILKEAGKKAKKLIDEHLDKVLELAEVLSTTSKIEYDELEKMVKNWGLEYKDKDNYHNFKDVFAKLKKSRTTEKTLLQEVEA